MRRSRMFRSPPSGSLRKPVSSDHPRGHSWWNRPLLMLIACVVAVVLSATAGTATASEADLAIPDLHAGRFFNHGDPNAGISAWNLLLYGAFVICGTLGISLYLRAQIKALPAHKSMLDVAEIIYETCKTYLIQQGKFLLMLWVLIALSISYYMLGFSHESEGSKTAGATVHEMVAPGEPTRTAAAAAP